MRRVKKKKGRRNNESRKTAKRAVGIAPLCERRGSSPSLSLRRGTGGWGEVQLSVVRYFCSSYGYYYDNISTSAAQNAQLGVKRLNKKTRIRGWGERASEKEERRKDGTRERVVDE